MRCFLRAITLAVVAGALAFTQDPESPFPGEPFPDLPYSEPPSPEAPPAEAVPSAEPAVPSEPPAEAAPEPSAAEAVSPAAPDREERAAASEAPRTLITGPVLTADDVRRIVEAAAKSADNSSMVIAVTDRQGDVLAVFRKPNAPAKAVGNFSQQVDTNELAVALARTAAFFSNSQAPLSSRTVRFISGVHFPPGISFTPNAALYGIENTNRGCFIGADYAPNLAVPPARSIDGTRTGLGIITGKKDLFDSDPNAVNPGGVPLYKEGELVGGIGVAGVPPQLAEYAAFIGAVTTGFGPTSIAAPGVVFVDGIALPFVEQQTAPDGIAMGTAEGTWVIGPRSAPGSAPEGDLVIPRAGPAGGLTQAEVRQIIDRAIAASNQTRAVIRLPLGSKARMVIAVADLDGKILGLHRMKDSTFFSIDVAIAKARNMVYFNSPDRAPQDLPGVPPGTVVTNRTISYGAQPFFPPGLDYTKPGPFFELYKFDVQNPCTQGSQPPSGAVETLPGLSKFRAAAEDGADDGGSAAEIAVVAEAAADPARAAELPPNPQNGVVFFAGALPLYKNGVLVGGLGISGDGVEQDDYVAAQAALGFEPPPEKRADRVFIEGVRLPYLKFPRNPTQ